MQAKKDFLKPIKALPQAVNSLLAGLKQAGIGVILVVATTPYVLQFLPRLPTIVCYESVPFAIEAAMAVVRGDAVASGVLPIRIDQYVE